MKQLYILFLLTLTFLSCEKQDRRNLDLIIKAYDITESDPQQGLLILDSVSDPSHMPVDLYLSYIVIYNMARSGCNQDISKDSLIFEAEKYFDKNDEPRISPLAHFWAGRTHLAADRKDKALFSFSKAVEKAVLSDNYSIAGRSRNNIAYIYFDENMMDSTITNAKKALYYFDKMDNKYLSRMHVITLIGRAYEDKNSLDSAYFYFDRGLQMAKKNNDLPMQAVFNHNLGLVMLDKNKYDKSLGYFYTALHQTSVSQDSLKIYMLLSGLYMQKNDIDSSRYYTQLINSRVSETDDIYTKRDIYRTLSEYMLKTGNYNEAFRYTQLQTALDKKIIESDASVDLIKAHNSLIISNNEKESSRLLLIALVILSLTLLTFLIAGFILYRKHKNLQQQNQLAAYTAANTANFEKEKKKINDRIKRYQESEKLIKEKAEISISNVEADKRTLQVDSYLSVFRLHKELDKEWEQIDKRINKHSESKPQFQEYMNGLLADLKKKRDTKLYDLAKDCLKHVRKGADIIPKLEANELIILVLSNSKYPDEVIGEVLDIKVQFIITLRIELKLKLQKLGFTEEIVREILFPDFKSNQSRN